MACASFLLATPAAAEDIAAAEALFNTGLKDLEAGRYEAACKAIAESQRLDPRPGTLFTLATCEERWGHIATAVTRYGDYLTLYDRLPADRRTVQGERPKLARAAREKLGPEVPQLTLALPPDAPPGTVVKRDGVVVAEAALGIALPVDPGEHALSTQVPGGPEIEQRIVVARGEKKTVVLEVKAASKATPPPPSPAAPVETGPSKQKVAAFVVGGIGVAGLVLGGVMGGLALAKKGVVSQHCGADPKDPTGCDQTGLDALGAGKPLAVTSTIGFVLGGVGVGTATVLFLTQPKAAKPAAGAQGRWLSAGVLSAGPAGTTLGVEGAW